VGRVDGPLEVDMRTAKKTSDLDLRHDVEQELAWDASIDAPKIGVAVEDGIVTLTGEVPTYTAKWRAERAAERVEGVRGIANEIQVKLTGDQPSDADIARRAADALKWNLLVPEKDIVVEVDHGWLTLKGEVGHEFQRNAAYKAVRDITGVRGVSNLIIIKPSVEAREIKEQIEQSFKRQAELDAQNVTVETNGNEVILRGTVRSLAERKDAERVAWSAPGVASVKSYLTISPPV